jgi:hypothetical protein
VGWHLFRAGSVVVYRIYSLIDEDKNPQISQISQIYCAGAQK